MKNLLVILVIAAAVGLFFHDKQQTADLAKAQSDNDALTKQLQDSQAEANGLKVKVQELTTEVTQAGMSYHGAPAAPASAAGNPGVWSLQGSGALDRPAYKDHQQDH